MIYGLRGADLARDELPHLKELEKKMHGKKIVFVSISCDKDKAAWEKMVKEKD
ncbi:MAG: thioredoxin-like domain-containing protein [Butyricimonas faecihominis]